ncbi:PaaI family thioesterase [Deinococcus sp. UR1]|uniref:PaaI family thioesterase n=1 Tax=Deinococcus sp. UR1 TaxID=1704277 RepID=UPI0006DC8C4E|nr:PaaI family thioesterase [Deinococcus sp. UR1]PIG97152.1 hypothetical protein AMD26_014130 [Deinococcus sp. UR1]
MSMDASGVEARVRASFMRQGAMALLGATVAHVAPGEVDLHLPFRPELTQQHGLFHGGFIATLCDSACGYAALTVLPAGQEVVSVEFKLNFMAPARGEHVVARGRVIRSGRTLTVCQGEVLVTEGGQERTVATMLATMMAVQDRAALTG